MFKVNATLQNVTVRFGNSTLPEKRGVAAALDAKQPCLDISATSGLGGGVLGVDSSAVVTASTVADCTGGAGGGLFFTGHPSTVLVDGSVLIRNRAASGGGIVAAAGAAVTLRGTQVAVNAATSGGAAFLSGGSTLSAVDCVFDRNTASYAGGAFIVGDTARLSANRSTVQSSHAGIAGVALLCSSQSAIPPFLVSPATAGVTLTNNRRAREDALESALVRRCLLRCLAPLCSSGSSCLPLSTVALSADCSADDWGDIYADSNVTMIITAPRTTHAGSDLAPFVVLTDGRGQLIRVLPGASITVACSVPSCLTRQVRFSDGHPNPVWPEGRGAPSFRIWL